ncbi:MAG: hypothetical protein Ct9H300mP13_4240 [Gammaproteobacteria bacterium]|nr:MAG: hypothetical protein Ct9H300mP13_4240 [Gammaproteobacteria bacterium]
MVHSDLDILITLGDVFPISLGLSNGASDASSDVLRYRSMVAVAIGSANVVPQHLRSGFYCGIIWMAP